MDKRINNKLVKIKLPNNKEVNLPLIESTLSKFISGKIMCSFIPKV